MHFSVTLADHIALWESYEQEAERTACMKATQTSIISVALACGIAFVCTTWIFNQFQMATKLTFLLLLPGILAGAIAPDSGFNPEGDTHPWGPISTFIVYAVNIVLYSIGSYLVLCFIYRRRISK